jgi:ubiquinone/menaquinone biosynthesis C-methylase UbiE
VTVDHWRHSRVNAAVYDFWVEHEWLAVPAGRLGWGTDVRMFYDDVARLGDLPEDTVVLDVPCGGGVAFRGLRTDLRYVAADLSPTMLGRARAEAGRRGAKVRFAQVSVDRLPFADGSFDVCVTYNGLHCFPDPGAALAEMTRVLRPGGQLRGTTLVTGAGRRQDAVIAAFRRAGSFGTVGTVAQLRRWLADAGLPDAEVTASGAVARIAAVHPGSGSG